MAKQVDIFEDFLIDPDFDENFYEEYYPEAKDYYLPTAKQVPKKKRLFHHYLLYGVNLSKNIKELEIALFGKNFKLDETFDEELYENIDPEVSGYFLPAARLFPKKMRLFHHYVTYRKTHQIYIPKKKRLLPKPKTTSELEPQINCKILIKIPTLNRRDNLIKCLESFQQNAHNIHDIGFCISCNLDDSSMNNAETLERIKKFANTYIFFGEHKNKIEAYNADVQKFNFDILVAASDDMEVKCENFDKIISSTMNKHFPDGDGVLWFDTGENNKTDTLSIIGKKYFDRFGYIYNNAYQGYYCDDEFTQVAFKLGKLLRINRQIIKHNIPSHIDMSNDNTYLKSLVFGTRDKAIYKIRKNVQFDIPGSFHLDKPFYCEFPKGFFDEKRNKDENRWPIYFTKFDDPISSYELYILEEMDKNVADMNLAQFLSFAGNYFRNFRMQIPPIIHQIWFGDMPKEIKQMMESFSLKYKQKFPGWRYILWDEKKLSNLEMINRDIFDQEQKSDSKSDIARLEILNRFGGWYLDSDFLWLGKNSFSELLPLIKNGFALAFEKTGSEIGSGFLNQNTKRVTNTLLGATVANPIIAFAIGELKRKYPLNYSRGSVACTGPDFIQNVISQIQNELWLKILDHEYFYPVWWCSDRNRNNQFDEHKRNLQLTAEELKSKYPKTIAYHKGFTSQK